MSEHFLAWCAGFFDGEGSVSIYRRERFSGRFTYILRATATQKHPAPLILFKDHFSGVLSQSHDKGGSCFHWIVTTRKAESFLRAIRPFTVVKSEQIDVALRFMSRRVPRGHGTSLRFREARARNQILDQEDLDLMRQMKATPAAGLDRRIVT